MIRTADSFIVGGGGTAVTADVLSQKTFSSSLGSNLSGAMTNNGAVAITPSSAAQTVAAGYHNGSGNVAAVSVPAGNVLAGTTIAGTAGTMPNQAAITINPSNAAQAIAAGYHNGSGSVSAVVVPAANVLTGTTIAGTAGTMPNQTAGGVVPTGVAKWGNGDLAVYPPQGYYKGGSGAGELRVSVAQLQSAEGAFIAGNILQGQTMYGVAGNATNDATMDTNANQLLTGYTAYGQGVKRNGVMPNNGTPTWTPNTANQGIAAGYYGGGTILGDGNLAAGNIIKGRTIFNVTGNVDPPILLSAPTSRGALGASPQVMKRATTQATASIVVSADIWNAGSSGYINARFYKNSVNIGDFSHNGPATNPLNVSVSSSCAPGDVYEFAIWGSSPLSPYCSNFLIKVNIANNTGGSVNLD